MEPVEIPKASEHHVWDPTMLSGLALWLELASLSNEVSFKVLDIAQRSSVTARMVPEGNTIVGDPEGKAAQLNCWKAWAGGAEVATICGDGAKNLVSVKPAGALCYLSHGHGRSLNPKKRSPASQEQMPRRALSPTPPRAKQVWGLEAPLPHGSHRVDPDRSRLNLRAHDGSTAAWPRGLLCTRRPALR